MSHGNVIPNVTRSQLYQGFFGRLFQSLPPHLHANERNIDSMKSYSDHMFETVAEANDSSLDNPRIPAGYTYFGQFVDHDITFDPVSSLERANDPDRLNNFRTPKFDLDSIYGKGPDDQPFLYDNDFKILIGKVSGTNEPDLHRNRKGRAIIGDPRNDENLLVAQMQLAFIKFHNKVIDDLPASFKGKARFEEAQRIVRWHYQWVVIHDYLNRLAKDDTIDDILPGPTSIKLRFFRWKNEVFMPVEFSVAAFRLGHSQVRNEYAINDTLEAAFGKISIFGGSRNLRGFRRRPKDHSIQWNRFLDFGGSGLQLTRKLDIKLANALSKLPPSLFPVGKNLAFRNLARGVSLELPSGQSIARAMGVKPISGGLLTGDDPLWVYILEEAGQIGGRHLGTVGSTIVGEVFFGLLKRDPRSFFSLDPCWRPENERVLQIPFTGSDFELKHIIKYAGMPITKAEVDALL